MEGRRRWIGRGGWRCAEANCEENIGKAIEGVEGEGGKVEEEGW